MKKLVCLLMSLVFAGSLFSFAACEKEAVGRTVYDEGDGSGGNLEIALSVAGFGVEWLQNIAKAYSKESNMVIAITATGNLNSQYISQIQEGTSPYDLVFTTGSQARLADEKKVEKLTDVIYNQTLEGHSKPIKEEMNQNIYQRLLYRDTQDIYFIDWANSVSGIFYNMTTLKEVYGDSFTEADLPKTTNELLDMSYNVSSKDGYVAWSTFAGSSYSDYMTLIWGAQYDTVQSYFDYYDLIYRDENGEPHVADTYDQIDSEGRLEAFKVIAEILNKENGLMHPAIDSMNYLDAQVAFAGNGFKGNNDKVAFIPSGDWMENELADYLPNNPQDFGILKSPVISSIVNTFTDAEDKAYFSDATEATGTYGRKTTVGDQRLSQLVTCIDENKTLEETRTALGYQDLDQVTYDRVAEARAVISCATMDHQMSVPNTSKNKENAFDFILYMLSDEGQSIYSDALGGRGMVYGYNPDTTDSSYMVKSVAALGNYQPVFVDYASPYAYLGGLRYYAVNDRYTQMCNGVSAETINQGVIAHWTENWATIKEAGKVS